MSNSFDHLKLSRADAEMLDRLVDVGFDVDQLEYLTPEDRQRANSILKNLGLLYAYPVEDASDTLIDATLARIDQYEAKHSARMQIHTPELETTSRGFRIRMPDLISVACMILVTFSVFVMLTRSARNQSITNECASNMAMVGHGLFNYASDNNGNTGTHKGWEEKEQEEREEEWDPADQLDWIFRKGKLDSRFFPDRICDTKLVSNVRG